MIEKEIEELEQELLEKKKHLTALKQSVPKKLVQNYTFISSNGEKTSLLECFKDQDELIVVHNMGKGCSYCTMWADGLNGIYHYLADKAAFVLSSPDSPDVLSDFAAERKWTFPMISTKESTFKKDIGFESDGKPIPGVSTFTKDERDHIYLHASAPFGPGDDFCAVWPLFDLLPSGSQSYRPKKKINEKSPYQLTNNIAIGVKNYQEAAKFYEEVIGMEKVQTLDNETLFSFNGTFFYIEDQPQQQTFFELAVHDFEQAKEELLEKGCQITKEIHEKSCMIADPFGMKFHLFESAQ
ncbi:DUF899 domain-containing protein [Falsibacillus albus]|uniref:DUF899 domain-containing protein n=2 Tax=Falsibacillus albus TaxID=2478915 RepID=A0A3L7JVG5_9BACI|nr:DUF899 domain-containing protein [Falsibacillus albus]